jgi:hypothetical protein
MNRFVQFNSGMFNLGRGHDPEPHPPAHSQGRVDKRTAREVTPTPARTKTSVLEMCLERHELSAKTS